MLPSLKSRAMKRRVRKETLLKTNNLIFNESRPKIQHEFLIGEEREILNVRIDHERKELVVLIACRDTTASLASSHER